MAKLSETALVLLNRAAGHPQGLVPHQGQKMNAPQQNVVRSLLKQNLLTELRWKASLGHDAWRQDDDGAWVLKITDEGYRALNIDPPGLDAARADATAAEAEAVANAMEAAGMADKPKKSLRDIAQAVVDLWEACDADGTIDLVTGMQPLVADLRAALAKPGRAERAPREPRGETKQDQVIAMLKHPDGATNLQIQEATEWAPHTVRGFFAGLKKKGFTILASKNPETKETVYRIPA